MAKQAISELDAQLRELEKQREAVLRKKRAELRDEIRGFNSQEVVLETELNALQKKRMALEKELQSIGGTVPSSAAAKPAPKAAAKKTTAKPAAKKAKKPTTKKKKKPAAKAPAPAAGAGTDLRAQILALLSKKPMSAAEVVQAVTTPQNVQGDPVKFPKRVEGHLGHMKRTNVITQDANKLYHYGASSAAKKPAAAKGKAKAKAKKGTASKSTKAKSTKKAKPAGGSAATGPSLREMLRDILVSATNELTSGQLADLAKKKGYKTAAKDFRSNVKSALSKMKDVVHVKNKGYRLKK